MDTVVSEPTKKKTTTLSPAVWVWLALLAGLGAAFLVDSSVVALLKPLRDSELAHVLRHSIRWLGIGYIQGSVLMLLTIAGLWRSGQSLWAALAMLALCGLVPLLISVRAAPLGAAEIGASLAVLIVLAVAVARGLTAPSLWARAGSWTMVCLVLSGGIANILKVLVHRPRPFVTLSPPDSWVGYLRVHEFQSFPSGESTTAFAVAASLSIWFPRLQVLLMIAATAVAAARVIVGNHFPSDVWAGAMLGVAVAQGVTHLARHRRQGPGSEV